MDHRFDRLHLLRAGKRENFHSKKSLGEAKKPLKTLLTTLQHDF
jgi:hypothetical protein